MQPRVELLDQIGVEPRGQVVNGTGLEAAKVVVEIAASVIPGARTAQPGGELGGDPDVDQGLERLVHGRQTDPGNLSTNRLINVLGRRMLVGSAEMIVHGEPLRRAPQTGILDDRAADLDDRAATIPSLISFPCSDLDEMPTARRELIVDATEPGHNSFKALVFLFLGRLTAVSTTC